MVVLNWRAKTRMGSQKEMTMEQADEAVFVYSAWPSPDAAQAAGAALVEARLAAAVNIIAGMTSIYRWQGAIERADETLMLIKTRTGRIEEIIAEVKRRHPYDEPGIAVVPLAGGSAGYLDWMRREST
jgi:periplasmic divalent cation tolerance protein